MLTRREFLERAAQVGGALFLPSCALIGQVAEPEGVKVNDVQSQLNATRNKVAKNIVICSDGTGQTDDGDNLSNVANLYSLLDLRDPETQICCYDPGVGTIPGPEVSATISHIDRCEKSQRSDDPIWVPRFVEVGAGQAVGYGLKENVEEMYSYLVDNYHDGDHVYLFGFSRGAFTVRVVAGLLFRCGLLLPGNLKHFQKAFELYEPHYECYKKLKELKLRIAAFKAKYTRPEQCKVHFLGIWDTVKSYGYFWPRSLPHTRHNPIVNTVRHALSIDEHRSFFALTTWGWRDLDQEEGCLPQDEQKQPQDVKEVWFAGDHSDVGGGHKAPENGLAKISLKWMINEAASCGLCVDKNKYRGMFKDLSPDRNYPHQFKRHDKLKENTGEGKLWYWSEYLEPISKPRTFSNR